MVILTLFLAPIHNCLVQKFGDILTVGPTEESIFPSFLCIKLIVTSKLR